MSVNSAIIFQIIQQHDLLKKIVYLIEELELAVIFEVPAGQLSKFEDIDGVNIWDK